MRRLAGLLIATVLAGAFAVGSAQAQRSCFVMQAELMHLLSRGQGGVADRGQYERAYREQANLLITTERRARRVGCFGGGFFIFRRAPSQECRVLLPRIREMQSNLARLDGLRRRAGSGNADRIHELRAMMQARGCALPGENVVEAAPRQDRMWNDTPLYPTRGPFRTLCVRTCDGYYFPISFSTMRDQLTVDAQSCQAMCPGAESELFYHSNPGGGPESMVSLAGQPYNSLPTAFEYRERYNPACTCRPSGGYSVAATQERAEAAPANPTARVPRPRPAPGQDPETLANRAGDLGPGVSLGESEVAAEDEPGIRIVGPAYWGAPQHDDMVIRSVPN